MSYPYLSAENLSLIQIQQLREAWQLERDQLQEIQNSESHNRRVIDNLGIQLATAQTKNCLQETYLYLTNTLCEQCKNPFPLVVEISKLISELVKDHLPWPHKDFKLPLLSVSATCIVKSGDSWIASSSSNNDIEMQKFAAPSLQRKLSGKAWNKDGFCVDLNVSLLLPSELLKFIHLGSSGNRPGSFGSINYQDIPFPAVLYRSADDIFDYNSILVNRYLWIFTPTYELFHENAICLTVFRSLVDVLVEATPSDSSLYDSRLSRNDSIVIRSPPSAIMWGPLLELASHAVMSATVQLLHSHKTFQTHLRSRLHAKVSSALHQRNHSKVLQRLLGSGGVAGSQLSLTQAVWQWVPRAIQAELKKQCVLPSSYEGEYRWECEVYVSSSTAVSAAATASRDHPGFPVVSSSAVVSVASANDRQYSLLFDAMIKSEPIVQSYDGNQSSTAIIVPFGTGNSTEDSSVDSDSGGESGSAEGWDDLCGCIIVQWLPLPADSRQGGARLQLPDSLADHIKFAVGSLGRRVLLPWISTHPSAISFFSGKSDEATTDNFVATSILHEKKEMRSGLKLGSTAASFNILTTLQAATSSEFSDMITSSLRSLLFSNSAQIHQDSFGNRPFRGLVDHLCQLMSSEWAIILKMDPSGKETAGNPLMEDGSEKFGGLRRWLSLVDNRGTLRHERFLLSDLKRDCYDSVHTLLLALEQHTQQSGVTDQSMGSNSKSRMYCLRSSSAGLESTGFLSMLHLDDNLTPHIQNLLSSTGNIHHSCAMAISASASSEEDRGLNSLIVVVGRYWRSYSQAFVDSRSSLFKETIDQVAAAVKSEQLQLMLHQNNDRLAYLQLEKSRNAFLADQLNQLAAGNTTSSTFRMSFVTVVQNFVFDCIERLDYELDRESLNIFLSIRENVSVDTLSDGGDSWREWVLDHQWSCRRKQRQVDQEDVFRNTSRNEGTIHGIGNANLLSPIHNNNDTVMMDPFGRSMGVTPMTSPQRTSISSRSPTPVGKKSDALHAIRTERKSLSNFLPHLDLSEHLESVSAYSAYEAGTQREFNLFINLAISQHAQKSDKLLPNLGSHWIQTIQSWIELHAVRLFGEIFQDCTVSEIAEESYRLELQQRFSNPALDAPQEANNTFEDSLSISSNYIFSRQTFQRLSTATVFSSLILLPLGLDPATNTLTNLLPYNDLRGQAVNIALPTRLLACLKRLPPDGQSSCSRCVDLPLMGDAIFSYFL